MGSSAGMEVHFIIVSDNEVGLDTLFNTNLILLNLILGIRDFIKLLE